MTVINSVGNTLTGSTGTGAFVGATAPTISQVTFSSTSGIVGATTNNAAAAGSVGELISSIIVVGSPVSFTTTNTPQDLTSISLTAGDWDVWGNISFNGGATTLVNYMQGWISSTSATLPDASLINGPVVSTAGTAIFAANYYGFCVPEQRFSLSGTTTIYLSGNIAFTVSTANFFGGIYARRVR
jgi:hypothetical protein